MRLTHGSKEPRLHPSVFVAPGAVVIGDVCAAAGTSVWYGTVVRGDVHQITLGERTNLQDLTVVHVTGGAYATHIGSDVTIGHRAIIHGCTIEDRVLVGMGAIVLDGAVLESGCIVGAGAVVPPRMRVPAGKVVMGTPARVVRAVSERERDGISSSAQHYVALALEHREARMLPEPDAQREP